MILDIAFRGANVRYILLKINTRIILMGCSFFLCISSAWFVFVLRKVG